MLESLGSDVSLVAGFTASDIQEDKVNHVSMIGLYLCRRRPTLPHTFACSTIGPAGLNCRVRDGNGWIPRGKITDKPGAFCAASEPCAEIPSKAEGSLRHIFSKNARTIS